MIYLWPEAISVNLHFLLNFLIINFLFNISLLFLMLFVKSLPSWLPWCVHGTCTPSTLSNDCFWSEVILHFILIHPDIFIRQGLVHHIDCLMWFIPTVLIEVNALQTFRVLRWCNQRLILTYWVWFRLNTRSFFQFRFARSIWMTTVPFKLLFHRLIWNFWKSRDRPFFKLILILWSAFRSVQ